VTEVTVAVETSVAGLDTGACRIVVLATEWFSAHGGLSTFNRRICAALAAAGAEVFCVVLKASQPEIDDARAAGVMLAGAPATPGGSERDALMRRPPLPAGAAPDVIIGHGRVTGPAAKAVAEDHYPGAARLHVVHMAPDEIEWLKLDRDDDAGERAEKRTRAELELGRDATRVVAVGPRLWKLLSREMSVFPGTRPPLRLDPGFDAVGPAVRHPPPGEPFQVLLLGRLEDSEIKGLDLAARAVAVAVSLRGPGAPEIELLVRGAPGGESAKMRAAIREWAGLPGLRVVVRPYSTDAGRLDQDLRRATVVLMPSRAEGFGLVGSEAIVVGTPVLVSGRSGLGELLQEVLPQEMSARAVCPVSGDDDRDAQVWGHSIAAVLRDREAAFRDAALLRRKMAGERTWAMAAEQLLQIVQTTA
jgi:glycosyltransferase involved in cell wall biosynthesis